MNEKEKEREGKKKVRNKAGEETAREGERWREKVKKFSSHFILQRL